MTIAAPLKTEFPSPRSFPLGLKHSPYLMGGKPLQSILRLAPQFAGIYRLQVGEFHLTFVYDPDLVKDLCDEIRYRKVVYGALDELRLIAGDALFTAPHAHPTWDKAHRILTPAFSARSMKDYVPQMLEITAELLKSWRSREGQDINVAADMTRPTLDTISLCGFNYRFHSFQRPRLHPFLRAMSDALHEAGSRISRPPLFNFLAISMPRYKRSAKIMNRLVDQVISERQEALKNGAPSPMDFLSLMLDGTDKKSGEKLDALNIRHQILTFLIAGHETTSGLLSFVIYELLKNPILLKRAQAEADAVIGDVPENSLTISHISQLKYIQQVLKEGLRLYPTAPLYTVAPYKDEVLGGMYAVPKDTPLGVLLPPLHRSPKYWGPNPEVFDPARFEPEKEAQIPIYAYRPFGNGQRACIGRNFAMAEAVLALSLILKNFDLEMADPNYKLVIKETLTTKPKGFKIRAKKRNH